MLTTPEISKSLRVAPVDTDERVINKILTKEVLDQPGAKIAVNFLDILGIPHGQWSSYDLKNSTNEKALAVNITNKAGSIYEVGNESFLSRDPRHFLENLDPKLKAAMDQKLANIFQNEYEHYKTKKDKGVMPFAYIRLPEGIDCVLKGYLHDPYWQREHGEYLVETAKEAKVLKA
jgi:hypothetical protein